MKYKIAIVIPAFNEEKSVNKLYKQIIESITTSKKISDYEIIFVNANSKDNTKKCIEKITNENKKVSLINNNKKYKADCLELGLKNVSKNIDLVFMMDADLQDDPKELTSL